MTETIKVSDFRKRLKLNHDNLLSPNKSLTEIDTRFIDTVKNVTFGQQAVILTQTSIKKI